MLIRMIECGASVRIEQSIEAEEEIIGKDRNCVSSQQLAFNSLAPHKTPSQSSCRSMMFMTSK